MDDHLAILSTTGTLWHVATVVSMPVVVIAVASHAYIQLENHVNDIIAVNKVNNELKE